MSVIKGHCQHLRLTPGDNESSSVTKHIQSNCIYLSVCVCAFKEKDRHSGYACVDEIRIRLISFLLQLEFACIQ